MNRSTLQLKLDELATRLGLATAPDWMPWRRGIKLTFDGKIPAEAMSEAAPIVFPGIGMMHHKTENEVSTLLIFDAPLSL
jgi:hypothetical protein